ARPPVALGPRPMALALGAAAWSAGQRRLGQLSGVLTALAAGAAVRPLATRALRLAGRHVVVLQPLHNPPDRWGHGHPAQAPRRHPDPDLGGRYVFQNHGPQPEQGPGADSHILPHHRAGADIGALSDLDTTAKTGTGAESDVVTYHVVVS